MTAPRPVTTPLRRDQYLEALTAAAPLLPKAMQRAVPVALAIGWTANGSGENALRSASQVARVLSCSEATVRRAIAALLASGWLTQVTQGGRRGNRVTASRYQLSQPVTLDDRLETTPNLSRLTLQPVTQVSASSLKRRGEEPPLGSASREVPPDTEAAATEPTDALEVAGFWDLVTVDDVLSWLAEHEDVWRSVPRIDDEVVGLLLANGAHYDIGERGVPDTGHAILDEALHVAALCGRLMQLRELPGAGFGDVSRWTLDECREAVEELAKRLGDRGLAWSALHWWIETGKRQGGGPMLAHRHLRDNPVSRTADCAAIYELDARLRRRPPTATEPAADPPSDAAPPLTPRPPW